MDYDPRRSRLWFVLTRYLEKLVPITPDSAVLDVGAGYCDFINQVRAKEKHAIDASPLLVSSAAKDIVCHVGSCLSLLQELPKNYFDVVMASNLLEHLSREEGDKVLETIWSILKNGQGKLIILQPNFAYCYRKFYDDYTHKTPYTHHALSDLLKTKNFKTEKMFPRFLPFSLKSRLPIHPWLLRLYLHFPIKPFAGQCLLVAQKV